jgi:hypothetical protein
MDNEKKTFIISIISILIIFSIVMFFNSSLNLNDNLIGKAIRMNENSITINDSNISTRTNIRDVSVLIDNKKCEASCPFGFEAINSSCQNINSSCSGSVICGYYYNNTLMNISNGHCAYVNIVPDVK